MGHKFTQATPTYIEGATVPVSASPFTMGCKFKANDITNRHQLMSLVNSGNTERYWELRLRGDSGGDPLQLRANNVGGANASTGNSYTANKWWTAIGVVASATDRKIYLLDPYDVDAGIAAVGSNTTNIAPSGVDSIAMGRRATVSSSELDGFGAETFIYSTDIALWAIRLLGLGYSPLDPVLAQYRGNLVWYKDLKFDIEYPNYGAAWTNTNTANDPDHPPMIHSIPVLSPPGTTVAAGDVRSHVIPAYMRVSA